MKIICYSIVSIVRAVIVTLVEMFLATSTKEPNSIVVHLTVSFRAPWFGVGVAIIKLEFYIGKWIIIMKLYARVHTFGTLTIQTINLSSSNVLVDVSYRVPQLVLVTQTIVS